MSRERWALVAMAVLFGLAATLALAAPGTAARRSEVRQTPPMAASAASSMESVSLSMCEIPLYPGLTRLGSVSTNPALLSAIRELA